MLRTGLVLLLSCAALPALAIQSGGHLAPAASVDCDQAEGGGAAGGDKPKPLVAPTPGGGDDDAMLPRTRGPKWHRLLPGMFR